MQRLSVSGSIAVIVFAAAIMLLGVSMAHAQTTDQNQLRATILAQIMADPRSKTMTQAQIYSTVNALTEQAEAQGLTASQITYRPTAPGAPTAASTFGFGNCTDVSCALGNAFGLNGSVPIIPIALFVLAALFILIFSIMRKMGHPHAQL
jgi:hypothetical protein